VRLEGRLSDGSVCLIESDGSRLHVASPFGRAGFVVGDGPGEARFAAVWTTPFFPALWGNMKSFTWGSDGMFKPLWCDEIRVLDSDFALLARVPAGAGWLEQPRYRAYWTTRDLRSLAPVWSYDEMAQLCAETGMHFVRGSTPHPRWFLFSTRVAYLRPPIGGRPEWAAPGVLRAPRR
jgi:hypothetical protein